MYTKDLQTLGMVENQIVAPETDRKVMGSGIMIVTKPTIPVAQEFTGMVVEPDLTKSDIVWMAEVYKMSRPL